MIVAVVIAAWLLGVLVGMVLRDARTPACEPLELSDVFDLDWEDPRRSDEILAPEPLSMRVARAGGDARSVVAAHRAERSR